MQILAPGSVQVELNPYLNDWSFILSCEDSRHVYL